MNKRIKKSIYLMMLSSLLLTGCSKENKLEKTNDIHVIDNLDDDYTDEHIENDTNYNDIAMVNTDEIKNDASNDLTNNNSDNQDEIDKVEDASIYESILPNESFENEEQVIEYFDKLKCDIELLLTVDNEDVDDKIESRVMLFVDYMVDDIKIGGYRFTDLDAENQMRIKKIYVEVDNMVEETKPDYKEMLISKSYKFKDFCVDKYHDIKEQIGSWYQDSSLKTSIDNYILDGKKLYEKYKQENK